MEIGKNTWNELHLEDPMADSKGVESGSTVIANRTNLNQR